MVAKSKRLCTTTRSGSSRAQKLLNQQNRFNLLLCLKRLLKRPSRSWIRWIVPIRKRHTHFWLCSEGSWLSLRDAYLFLSDDSLLRLIFVGVSPVILISFSLSAEIRVSFYGIDSNLSFAQLWDCPDLARLNESNLFALVLLVRLSTHTFCSHSFLLS